MGRSQRIFKKIKKNPPIRHAVNFANSYTTEQIPEVSESMEAGPSQLETPRSRQPSPTPSISPSPSSSSERKLNVSMLEYDNYASTHVYDIVDLNKLNDVIRSMACCKNCGEDISLEPYSRVGIAVSISLKCTKCSNKAAFRNCERIERKISEGKVLKAYSLNLRLVYGMRCIGKGWSSANTFMAAMNLPPAPTKFQLYTKILLGVIKEKCHESMKQSVIEAIQENEGSRDLTVTFDGTWQKRGHTSLNGVITAISGEPMAPMKLFFCSIEETLAGYSSMRPLFSLDLASGLINALAKAGFFFLEDLIDKDSEDCQAEALEIIEHFGLNWDDIRKSIPEIGSVSAAQLLRKDQLNESIPTFCEVLDNMLGGGVQTSSLLQISGPPGSGKTQLGLQLCISVQIPVSLRGLGAESVFIDTEGTFSPTRIREIASAASDHCRSKAKLHNVEDDVDTFTTDFILGRIHYISVGNLMQLTSSIQMLNDLLQNNLNIKLIVIDTITFPFLKITNHLERTRHISIIVQDLQNLATKYNLSIVMNNHLTTKISQESKVLAPALGESFTHLIPNTLLLGIVENSFSAVLYKSCYLKGESVRFKICADGIRDTEES